MVLSDISIRNPVFAWMLMAAFIIFGFICFIRMGVSNLPDVDFPVVNVSITLPNASPEVVESDVADPVEQAVLGAQGVQDVQTTCTQGNANISVFLDLSRNVDSAVQDVQTLVSSVLKQLPTTIFPPVIRKQNPNASPIIWLAVTADPPLTLRDLMLYSRDHIQDKFTSLNGVANVFLGGFVNREINIWVDNNKLNARQLTAEDIINTIEHQHMETPAGALETSQIQYNIRVMGEAYTVPDFANLPIITRGGTPNYKLTRLKDIATIEDGVVTPITRMSRFDGVPAVGLGIVMQDGFNAVDVGNAAKARMEEVKKLLPKGYHLTLNFDTTKFISDNVHELELTILLATFLTAGVCFLFLGSFSSTVNIFLAIPTSLFGTFIVMSLFGFNLNTFTLMVLSLSIGVVVDDASMVLENIVRHQEKGEDQVEAALVGAREITFAAMATSVAIVAIFLPIAFMQGVIGKFFFQFGVTLSGAVLISLLEAITLTPMRCSEFVHAADEHSPFNQFVNNKFDALKAFYTRSLHWALDHRWTVLLISIFIFLSSFLFPILKLIKVNFTPATDQSAFIVNMKFPVTYSLDHTNQIVRQCEAIVKQRGEVKHLYTPVGGFGGSTPNQAVFFLTMKEPGDRPKADISEKFKPTGPLGFISALWQKSTPQVLTEFEFMAWVRTALSKVSPDMQVYCLDLSQRGMSTGQGYSVELMVTGPDWDTLADCVRKIRKAMHASPKLADVNDNFLDGQPELRIVPDRTKAAQMGVAMDDLGNVVSATIGGYQFQGTYFHEGGHDNPIAIRVPVDQRKGPDSIKTVYVRNNRGEVLPISAMSDLIQVSSYQQIFRDNRQRAVYFTAGAGSGTSQQDAVQEAVNICKSILPQGYDVQLTGSAQSNASSMQQLLFVMMLGILVAYMVLASQFNSFVHPIIILLALPFSVTGAFFAMWLFSQSLGIYSIIGIILLMGLVKKNSIMLVDFTNQRRHQGMDVRTALMDACPVRLRPILMTSSATVAGALPAALAWGPGAELRQPMAVAIIGGIIFSTILTLLVVPCAYSLMSNLERRKAHHSTGFHKQEVESESHSEKKSSKSLENPRNKTNTVG
jgi:HAE1 family hydrophobic/amphiphilic exporter-1